MNRFTANDLSGQVFSELSEILQADRRAAVTTTLPSTTAMSMTNLSSITAASTWSWSTDVSSKTEDLFTQKPAHREEKLLAVQEPEEEVVELSIYQRLFDTFMSESDDAEIFPVIRTNCAALTQVAEQMEALPHMKKRLVLDDCKIDAERICQILQTNKRANGSIQCISLKRTHLTDSILEAVCHTLLDDHLITSLE